MSTPSPFEQLLTEHNATLVNRIYARIHYRAEAQDIAQEAFIRLYALGPAVADNPRALLYSIAKNLVIDWCRKRNVRRAYVEERAPHILERATCDFAAPSPERIWSAVEDLAHAHAMIKTLPARTQMALKLIRDDGLSYDELGVILGIKTHSARRLIERAMEYLAEQVA